MKIALFSDIHSNLEALEAILENIKQDSVDEIICLGDVLAIGPNPKECLDLILNNKVRLLLGNHELYYINGTNIDSDMSEGEKGHQQWVANQLGDEYKVKLQDKELMYELEYNNIKMIFSHFFLKENNKYIYPFNKLEILKNNEINHIIKTMNYDYIFYGHEHYGKDIYIDNKKCINVRTSGCVKTNVTSYIILEIEEDSFSIFRKNVIYDRETFAKKMKEINYPEKQFVGKSFFGVDV